MYIDGFAKFLVIFVQKYIFTSTTFNQNCDVFNKFLVEFPSWNVYFYIRYLICFEVYDKNKFHKKLQNCKSGTILKRLVVKPQPIEAKPLAGVQGQSPRKLLGFSHIKDQNQHFEPHPSEDFLLSVLLFFLLSVIFFWERRSRGFWSPGRRHPLIFSRYGLSGMIRTTEGCTEDIY